MPLPSSLSLIFFDQNFLRRLLPSSICSPLLSSHQLSKRSASLKLTNVFKKSKRKDGFLGLSPTSVSPDYYTVKSAIFVVWEFADSKCLTTGDTRVIPDKTIKWYWKIPIYNLPFSNSPFWEEGYGVHSGANMCRDIGWQSRYCFNSQYLNWKRPRPPSFPHPINLIFQLTNEHLVRILLRCQNKREKISPSSVNHEILNSTL